jgi:phage tail-like protein
MAVTELSSVVSARQETRRAELAVRGAESAYIRYLPTIYQQDLFFCRFLMIFESVLRPIEGMVDTLPAYTEPEITPDDFLPWLAQWVALALDHSWPLARQRALIAHAVEIYRWRGTSYGLKLHIRCYTGIEPLIQEYRAGFVLGADNRLGWTTLLTDMPANSLQFVVTVPVFNPREVDAQMLRLIIEESKPAHTTYRLRLVRAHAQPPHIVPPRGGPR